MSDAMSVTESQGLLHARQRRLNVIQTTKRHLGLETWAPAAVPASQSSMYRVCAPLSPPASLLGPHGEWHAGQHSLAARGIKANIFSLNQIVNEGMISAETLLTERQVAAFLAAAVTLLVNRLFWHQIMVWGWMGGIGTTEMPSEFSLCYQ